MTRPALGRYHGMGVGAATPTLYLKQLQSNLTGQIILVSLTSTEWGCEGKRTRVQGGNTGGEA